MVRLSLLTTALTVAAGVSASPIERRYIVTELDIVTVTEYVTEGFVAPAAPTSIVTAGSGNNGGNVYFNGPHGNGGHHSAATSTAVSIAETTSAAEVVIPVASSTSVETSTSVSSTSTEAAVVVTTTAAPVVEPTTTAAPVVEATTSTAAAAASTATGYESVVLYQHNVHRANHSATDLAWNSTLASIALEIAQTCVYEHNVEMGGGGYGQNIGAGTETDKVGEMITNAMYNGEINYYPEYGVDSPDMTNFEEWGHFSQIVWKNTESVGCATYYCSGGLSNVGSNVEPYFTVCNYYPPGNYEGEYTNVGSPLGDATVVAA